LTFARERPIWGPSEAFCRVSSISAKSHEGPLDADDKARRCSQNHAWGQARQTGVWHVARARDLACATPWRLWMGAAT